MHPQSLPFTGLIGFRRSGRSPSAPIYAKLASSAGRGTGDITPAGISRPCMCSGIGQLSANVFRHWDKQRNQQIFLFLREIFHHEPFAQFPLLHDHGKYFHGSIRGVELHCSLVLRVHLTPDKTLFLKGFQNTCDIALVDVDKTGKLVLRQTRRTAYMVDEHMLRETDPARGQFLVHVYVTQALGNTDPFCNCFHQPSFPNFLGTFRQIANGMRSQKSNLRRQVSRGDASCSVRFREHFPNKRPCHRTVLAALRGAYGFASARAATFVAAKACIHGRLACVLRGKRRAALDSRKARRLG